MTSRGHYSTPRPKRHTAAVASIHFARTPAECCGNSGDSQPVRRIAAKTHCTVTFHCNTVSSYHTRAMSSRNPSSSGTARTVPLHTTSSSRQAHSGASHAAASSLRHETNRIYAESQVQHACATAPTNTSLPLGPNCCGLVHLTHSHVLLLQFKTDGERVFHSREPASPHHPEQPQYQVPIITHRVT